MTLTERFRNLFRPAGKQQPNIPVTVVAEPAPTGNTVRPVPVPLPFSDKQETIHVPADVPVVADTVPAWLEDEDLLRDEAVLFGLSEARADEKVALIKHYFAHRTADLERTAERYNEQIGELNLFIEQKENLIGELEHKHSGLENRQPAEHHLPRTLAGLAISVVMCTGNYFLIADTLLPAFPRNSALISIGVFLAGMFNLFSRTSFLHETSAPVTPRRLLEEVGLPLAASFFVLVQALQTQPVLNAVALFVFIFFLFLLAGKLLLGTLTVLHRDLRTHATNQLLDTDKRTKLAGWESEIQQLKREIDDIRAQKWQILPNLNRAEASLDRLNARRDMLVSLFISEFNLARQLRSRLTEKQQKEILDGQ